MLENMFKKALKYIRTQNSKPRLFKFRTYIVIIGLTMTFYFSRNVGPRIYEVMLLASANIWHQSKVTTKFEVK